MSLGTVLTLFVVPAVYTLLSRRKVTQHDEALAKADSTAAAPAE